jgi:hypothetical protein
VRTKVLLMALHKKCRWAGCRERVGAPVRCPGPEVMSMCLGTATIDICAGWVAPTSHVLTCAWVSGPRLGTIGTFDKRFPTDRSCPLGCAGLLFGRVHEEMMKAIPASLCALLREMDCIEPPRSTLCNESWRQQPSRTQRSTAGDTWSANVPSDGCQESPWSDQVVCPGRYSCAKPLRIPSLTPRWLSGSVPPTASPPPWRPLGRSGRGRHHTGGRRRTASATP